MPPKGKAKKKRPSPAEAEGEPVFVPRSTDAPEGDAAGVLRLERSDGATVGYAFAAPIIAAGD